MEHQPIIPSIINTNPNIKKKTLLIPINAPTKSTNPITVRFILSVLSILHDIENKCFSIKTVSSFFIYLEIA